MGQSRATNAGTRASNIVAIADTRTYWLDNVALAGGEEMVGRVLGKLQSLLQAELGSNPRVLFPTSHLRSTTLSAIAASIWS
jgi:hypothetical protein